MTLPAPKALALSLAVMLAALPALAQETTAPAAEPEATQPEATAPEAAPEAEVAPAGDEAPVEEAAAPEAGAVPDADGTLPADDAAPGPDAAPEAGAPAEDAAVPVAETEPAPGPFFEGLEVIGQPQAGGVGFPPAATSLAADVHWLDGLLLVMITIIVLFVSGLIAWSVIRYNRKANQTPATFTHNSPLEVTWTIVPILILVSIGAFSLPVLFDQQRIPEGDVVVKVSGFQWAWNYEYPEEGISFDSYMIGADTGNQLTEESLEDLRLAGYSEDHFRLATDTSVVVPVGQTVVMQVTATDVIHSWTIPSFGVKQDGIPGRLAQLWFRADAEGVYFGQCSELCGISHAFMPITVKVVSQEEYDRWLAAMKSDNPPFMW